MKKKAAILFYLFLPAAILVSLFPLRIHYLFSKVLYFIGYKLFGYRRNVVKGNLSIAFPEKNDSERLFIERAFYHFFFDLFVEGIKIFTASRKRIKKMIGISPELLNLVNSYYDKGENIFVVMPHYGNWELGNFGAQLYFKHQVNCIYQKLNDPSFDYFLFRLRTRWGSGMFPMQQAFRKIVSSRKEINATGFIADQSAGRENAQWISFFNKEVPFYIGIESMAKKLNTPVIYVYFDRDEKNHYQIKGSLITDKPQLEEEGYILKTFAENLERQIKIKPHLWLWTHRRWKRTRD